MNQDLFLRGTDAYYYALQSDFWFRTGKVKIPDSSFIHRLLGCIQYLGFSAEIAFKIWVAFSVFVFSLISTLNRYPKDKDNDNDDNVAVFVFLTWIILSPTIVFCAIEFPKNFGLVTVIALLPFLLSREKNRLRYFLPSLAVLSILIHRSALIYLGFLAIGFTFPFLLKKNNKIRMKNLVLLLLGTGTFIFLYRMLIVDHINLQDLLRVNHWNLMPGIVSLLGREGLPLAIKIELAVSMVLAVCIFWKSIHHKSNSQTEQTTAISLLLPSFLPCWGNEVFSFGERFSLFLPLILLILAPYCFKMPSIPINKVNLSFSSVALIAIFSFSVKNRLDYAHPLTISPQYEDFQMLVNELQTRKLPMLIAHQGFNFFYKFKTTQESFSYEPEDHWNKSRIWRLLYGLTTDEVNFFIPKNCGWRSGEVVKLGIENYHLIREDCYVQWRNAISKDTYPDIYSLVHESTLNPSHKRPGFLYAKHVNDDPNDEFPAILKRINSN